MFSDFAKALGQIHDPRFLRVVALGVGLALALLIGVTVGTFTLIGWLVPATVELPFLGPVGGVDLAASIGSVLVMMGLSVFLMMPVAALFSGLFLESVTDAVEDRHYPTLPPAQPVPLSDSLIDAANLFGLLIFANALALLLYPFVGPLIPVVFWALNGFLLGREYFTLVAMRRLGRQGARALRARHTATIWIAGTLMAAPLSIPVLNLVVPVLGVATFTHLFHRLNRG
ncbi:EI24 domain-containing protein [Gemmobacter aquatilis]|uniref:EI24 domain-containing protein n=1 Tax=Gemmobacter aquatilis TaxID=933059 RepID=UPI000B891576|nr:EI24 domain-containing protein [Gemmobacter aquatilis]